MNIRQAGDNQSRLPRPVGDFNTEQNLKHLIERVGEAATGAPIWSVDVTETSTTGVVTISITDPNSLVTSVEFRTMSPGSTTWSGYVVDASTPYTTSVARQAGRSSRIGWRITWINAGGETVVEEGSQVFVNSVAAVDPTTGLLDEGVETSGGGGVFVKPGVEYPNDLDSVPDSATYGRTTHNQVSGATYAFDGLTVNGIVKADKVETASLQAGAVTADKIDVDELDAISANVGHITAGRISSPDGLKGILLNGELPSTWLSYINFLATGVQEFLKHSALRLYADGTAVFTGAVMGARISDRLQAYVREAIEWLTPGGTAKARIAGETSSANADAIWFEHGSDASKFATFDASGALLGDDQYRALVVVRQTTRPQNPVDGLLWFYGGGAELYIDGLWWPWGLSSTSDTSSTVTRSPTPGNLPLYHHPAPTITSISFLTSSSAVVNFSTTGISGALRFRVIVNGPDGMSFLDTADNTATNKQIISLRANATYTVRVVAIDFSDGSGGYDSYPQGAISNPITFTTSAVSGLAVPTNVAAVADSSSQITITWTDNSTSETLYAVYESTDGISFTSITTVGPNVTSYARTGRTAGTTYYYKVAAVFGTSETVLSDVASATTPAGTAPTAPTIGSASANSSSQITVTWVDNSSNETGFKLYRSTSSGGTYTQVQTAIANATSRADTGLTASTTYWYKVSAYNTFGESALSSAVSATTLAGGGGGGSPPSAPSNFRDTAVTASSITMSWDHSGSDLDGFLLYRNGVLIDTLSSGDRSYNDTGLFASTTYSYSLTAYNANGNSSTVGDSATTTSSALTAPTGLSLSDASVCDLVKGAIYQVEVSWSSGDATAETEVYRDGSLVWTASAGETSGFVSGGASAGSKTISIRHVKAGFEDSASTSDSITLVDPCA